MSTASAASTPEFQEAESDEDLGFEDEEDEEEGSSLMKYAMIASGVVLAGGLGWLLIRKRFAQ